MGFDRITERQVIGWFFQALAAADGMAWINATSNYFTSDQASEEYAWLGQVPQLREWVGGRNAKGFRENGLTIANKHFESTLEILVKDLRRDKTGQAVARIAELARRANSHWASMLSTLIANGESGVCYDESYFFDTTHNEGNSGDQSNLIDADLSTFPVLTGGSTTVPAVAEMQFSIVEGIKQLVSFVDDQGEPINEDATSFLVMVPVSLMNSALQAVATPVQVAETQTALQAVKSKFAIDVAVNPRLSSWTDSFVVFRTDSRVKSLIRQEETAVSLKVKGYGSEYEFDNDAHQYGIDTWRNVGYGLWQNACKVTMT